MDAGRDLKKEGGQMKTTVKTEVETANVLSLNCGSSSLKYKLIAMPGEKELAAGEAQRIGPKTAERARIVHRQHGKEETIFAEMPGHSEAFEQVLLLLRRRASGPVDVIGHRVVHGADIFKAHTLIDDNALAGLKKTLDIAPLHNPPAVALIETCHKTYPELAQAAVFDTVFHSTIPWHAAAYALPKILSRRFRIKKYGFHGTSHKFVAEEAAKFLHIPLEKLNAVSCHLGSGGASLCAIVNGRSIDNTMGYSPLPGLVMSTRSGDIDPALALQLSASGGMGFKGL
jgi:acetate kinase